MLARPSCFISYSWDSDTHKDWVRRLAIELTINGIQTYVDQWDVRPGMDLAKYVETCVRESDFVLLVCTPNFAQKANSGKGGVGYEKAVVTGEIFEGCPSEKFVPILWRGGAKESLPSYLKAMAYVDFRKKDKFKQNLESLLRHLYKSPRYVRPPVGRPPVLKPIRTTVGEPHRRRLTRNHFGVPGSGLFSYQRPVLTSLPERERLDARRIYRMISASSSPTTITDVQRRQGLSYRRAAKTVAVLQTLRLIHGERLSGRTFYVSTDRRRKLV